MTTANDVALTAMCLWEAVLEYCADDYGNNSLSSSLNYEVHKSVSVVRINIGAARLRDTVLGFAKPCHDEWEVAVAAGYDDSFDWEWCPAWLDARVDWTWSPGPAMRVPTLEQLAILYHGKAS